MDVVFDEVKGNVVGSAAAAPGAAAEGPAPKPAGAERKIHEDLMRLHARRARLLAD